MAYDDPGRYGEQTAFRDDPDNRTTAYQTAVFGPESAPAPAGDGSAVSLRDVFDDPAAGDPGRDRLVVHWIWEFLLLSGVAAVAYLLWQEQPELLRGDNLAGLLIQATGFCLLGLAAGLALRAASPNLAIGAVAAAAGAYFAQRGHEGVAVPTVFMLGVAIVLGLAVAVVVVALHVPAWAASLAAAAAAVVWLQLQSPEIPLSGAYDPTGQAAFLFAVVAAVAVLGGMLGTVKAVRRSVGRFRPIQDPARRRGGAAALLASAAMLGSMVLPVVAGVLLVAGDGGPAQGSVGVDWFTWTVIGFGVALVGGTSGYGRRGGVFGTLLASVGLVLFHQYQQVQGWRIALLATAAVMVVAGLLVTRLVERFGKPRSAGPAEWEPVPATAPLLGTADDSNPGPATDAWSSALPARPAPGAPWDDERWPSR